MTKKVKNTTADPTGNNRLNSVLNRRHLLKLAAAGLSVYHMPSLSANSAKLEENILPKKKFIWIILRGGMDSLHAVVPTFDKDLASHRSSLIQPIENTLLPLGSGFGLHPSLKFLHTLYKQGQFSPVVATATPYRNRSHFDAQDLLEGGRAKKEYSSGWLGRALIEQQAEGIAIARSIPLALRSSATARTWYPSNLPDADEDLFTRLMSLYKDDQLLSSRLSEAIETNDMVGDINEKGRPNFSKLAESCAVLLKDKNGPHCAMLEMSGWDTHNNLVGRLDNQFMQLDQGLQTLKSGLGDEWKNTVIAVASEFGRTVKNNGTKGSDHGTGSAMFLAGGAIKGGRILGNWPGLAANQLFEGRDLMPTSDVFSWTAALLQQHWGLSSKAINNVFPDSKPVEIKLV